MLSQFIRLPALALIAWTLVVAGASAEITIQSEGYQPVFRESPYLAEVYKVRDRWYQPQVECYDIATEASCADYPATLTPGGTPFQTPEFAAPVLWNNRYLYIPAARPNAQDWGLACYDVVTKDACGHGFVRLGEVSSSTLATATFAPGDVYLTGPALDIAAGRLYAYDISQRLYCVEAGTGQPCNGFDYLLGDYSAILPAFTALSDNAGIALSYDPQSQSAVLFSNFLSGANTAFAGDVQSYCVNVASGDACELSAGVVTYGDALSDGDLVAPFTLHDNFGAVTGHCTVAEGGSVCEDGQGNLLDLAAVVPELDGQFSDLNGTYDFNNNRTYFAAAQNRALLCYSWADSAPCADFGVDGTITFDQEPTGVAVTQGDSCGFVVTNGSTLYSFDRLTGQTPCAQRTFLSAEAGIIYDSVRKLPIAGARVTVRNLELGVAVAPECLLNDSGNPQITGEDGSYTLAMNFNDVTCDPLATYGIEISAADEGFFDVLSDGTGAATRGGVSAPLGLLTSQFCFGDPSVDALPSDFGCHVQPQSGVPSGAAPTGYYLQFYASFDDRDSIANNHIPLDPAPVGEDAVAIFKRAITSEVSVGEAARWEIDLENQEAVQLTGLTLVDQLPPGFIYRASTAKVSYGGGTGVALEPAVDGSLLTWELDLAAGSSLTISFESVIGAGTPLGLYQNQARVVNSFEELLSPTVTASIRVLAEPAFDCADVLGKVFQDTNSSGAQEAGERGLGSVSLYSVEGTVVTTDQEGRFSFPCALVPNAYRGSTFTVKVDPKTVPSGYRVAGRNPVITRLTRGKVTNLSIPVVAGKKLRIFLTDEAFAGTREEQQERWKTELTLVRKAMTADVQSLIVVYNTSQDAAVVSPRLRGLKTYMEQLASAAKWKGQIEALSIKR